MFSRHEAQFRVVHDGKAMSTFFIVFTECRSFLSSSQVMVIASLMRILYSSLSSPVFSSLDMLPNVLSAVKKKHPLVCIWFKVIKQTVRENSTRQEAVTFGQNQNIICDSVPCQECVVWIVIAGNIVIGKGLRSVKPETCILKSFVLFFLQTQV